MARPFRGQPDLVVGDFDVAIGIEELGSGE